MKEHFFIERRGKRFVLYAGLLDEAHSRGLRSIDTELLQEPDMDNGYVAIVKARAEMEEGRHFSGIGDASPENVTDYKSKRLVAMAETRAKARALRDAVNIGVTAFEEMGEDEPREVKASDFDLHPADRKRVETLNSLIRDAWGEPGIQRFVFTYGPIEKLSREEIENHMVPVKDALQKRQERKLKAT